MVQHCAWHYRWTGDLAYLRTIWPACRRALEHALTANDPDGDGYHTDYYMYNDGDTHERGGRSVGQQQLAIAALRFGAEMAAHLRNDTDQQRYERLANSTAQKMQHSLWHPKVGAFVDGEWSGEMRPHPEAMSEWPATTMLLATGDITPMQGYLASRYVAETLHVTSPSDPNVTIELISDFLPVKWSHHYAENGHAGLSIVGAALTGNIDRYWPVLVSAETVVFCSVLGVEDLGPLTVAATLTRPFLRTEDDHDDALEGRGRHDIRSKQRWKRCGDEPHP